MENANGRATLAQLGAVVDGLSSTVSAAFTRIDGLNTKIDTRLEALNSKIDLQARPNFSVWISGAALLVTVGLFVLTAGGMWTTQRIAPLEEDTKRIERNLERAARMAVENDKEIRTELKEAIGTGREERRSIREEARSERAAIIAEFKEIRRDSQADIKDIRTSIVSRGEHEQRWAAQNAALTAIDRRLDETRKQLADISSPQDAFKELQRQISELRSMVIGNAKPTGQ